MARPLRGGTVCLIEQTSAMAFDAGGEATAATDALGRVAAASYNEAGQAIAGYGGQIIETGATGYSVNESDQGVWTFSNLTSGSMTPTTAGVYDIYYWSPTGLPGFEIDGVTGAEDPTHPSLGGNWQFLEAVQLDSPSTSSLSLLHAPAGTPPTAVCLLQQNSATTYDADGEAIATTDALGHTTASTYDNLGRLVTTTQAAVTISDTLTSPVTSYRYDADGNELSETDPNGNETDYAYDGLNREVSQSEYLKLAYGASSTLVTTNYAFDADGNLIQETNADGAVTLFTYDSLNRETGETWYPNATDATDETGATNMLAFTYDADGELLTAGDDYSSYTYSYNTLGEATSVDNNGSETGGTPGVPDVVLSSSYDADGNRTQLSAAIAGTADFVNGYSYDSQNRQTQVTQQGVTGGDGVDPKTVNFTYNADGQFATIDRFNDLTDSPVDRISTSTYQYDGLGRLMTLTNSDARGGGNYDSYAWTYDADNEATSFSSASNPAESVGSYSYDAGGQLTGATPATGQSANAANSLVNTYDVNGNAGNVSGAGTTTIGAGNTLLFDGTYYDTYDADGNLILQANSATDPTSETVYTYDNRDRLTSVVDKVFSEEFGWFTQEEVDYAYDMFNNLIARTTQVFEVRAPTSTTVQQYVFDGTNPVLAFTSNLVGFAGESPISESGPNLTDHYLWGPAVDQILADEQFGSGVGANPSTPGTTLWALSDNKNTVRDLVDDSGTLVQHIAYTPFGLQLNESYNPHVAFAFGYTGTYTDSVTGYQLHGVRWYDPVSQRWLTRDPSGLGPDSNPYRYCGNGPTDWMDPSGLYPDGYPDRVGTSQPAPEASIIVTGAPLNYWGVGDFGQPYTQSVGRWDTIDASTSTPWVKCWDRIVDQDVCTGYSVGCMQLYVSAPKGTWNIAVFVEAIGTIQGCGGASIEAEFQNHTGEKGAVGPVYIHVVTKAADGMTRVTKAAGDVLHLSYTSTSNEGQKELIGTLHLDMRNSANFKGFSNYEGNMHVLSITPAVTPPIHPPVPPLVPPPVPPPVIKKPRNPRSLGGLGN